MSFPLIAKSFKLSAFWFLVLHQYGLLFEESWDEDVVRDKTFIWNVKGSDCTNNMCIKYDAWGDGEDTWYIKGLTVELSIGPNI